MNNYIFFFELLLAVAACILIRHYQLKEPTVFLYIEVYPDRITVVEEWRGKEHKTDYSWDILKTIPEDLIAIDWRGVNYWDWLRFTKEKEKGDSTIQTVEKAMANGAKYSSVRLLIEEISTINC